MGLKDTVGGLIHISQGVDAETMGHISIKNHVHAEDGKSLGGFDNVAPPAYVSFD